MIEEVLKIAAAQVPHLVVLAIIVMMFLKHMKAVDEAFIAHLRAFEKEASEARAHSREIIERNIAAFQTVMDAIKQYGGRL